MIDVNDCLLSAFSSPLHATFITIEMKLKFATSLSIYVSFQTMQKENRENQKATCFYDHSVKTAKVIAIFYEDL